MPSSGYKLLHTTGLRQGSYIPASVIPEEERKRWINSRPEEKRREWKKNYRIVDNNILVVLSQDCDIACADDSIDPLIEIAVCTPITAPHAGSKYAYSAKKIHFEASSGEWYEAKASNIVYAHKASLSELVTSESVVDLPENAKKSLPQWRALRYNRTALPDTFNAVFKAMESSLCEELDSIGKEHIRAMYIELDSYEEKPFYEFEFFALLNEDAPDEVVTQAIECIERLQEDLEETGIGRQIERGESHLAARADLITVSYLLSFVRINFDSLSLELGDDELDVETG